MNFIDECQFVRSFDFFLCHNFPFLIKLLERFDDIITPRCRPLIFLIAFDDLINISQFISNISFHFFLFGPLHFRLISAWPWTELMQFSLIINEISSFCLMLSGLLSFFDFSILSLFNLLQGITINLPYLVAWNTIPRRWTDRVIKFTNPNSTCHLINSTLIMTYFYFNNYFNFFLFIVYYQSQSIC